MSQQSLFDTPDHPEERARRDKAHTERVREAELGEGVKGPPEPQEESDVAEYIRRKDREEMKERQERNTLHAQATRQIGAEGKMYCLLWAMSDQADVDDDMRRAAFGVKNRVKSLLHAKKQDTNPGDPDHIGLGDAWPYDDDNPPKWHTRPTNYRRDLVSQWFADWRHLLPTEVLDDAIEQTDMPHL